MSKSGRNVPPALQAVDLPALVFERIHRSLGQPAVNSFGDLQGFFLRLKRGENRCFIGIRNNQLEVWATSPEASGPGILMLTPVLSKGASRGGTVLSQIRGGQTIGNSLTELLPRITLIANDLWRGDEAPSDLRYFTILRELQTNHTDMPE